MCSISCPHCYKEIRLTVDNILTNSPPREAPPLKHSTSYDNEIEDLYEDDRKNRLQDTKTDAYSLMDNSEIPDGTKLGHDRSYYGFEDLNPPSAASGTKKRKKRKKKSRKMKGGNPFKTTEQQKKISPKQQRNLLKNVPQNVATNMGWSLPRPGPPKGAKKAVTHPSIPNMSVQTIRA